jgi:hypothetical protein
VKAERREIPAELLGRNFRTDRGYRRELEVWVDQLWRSKDDLISAALTHDKPSQHPGDQGQGNAK